MKKKKIFILFLITIVILTFASITFAGVTDVIDENGIKINTTVRDNYSDYDVTGTIDLTDGKSYVVDCTKTDNLSKGLKGLSKIEETKYFKINENDYLVETENINDAIFKFEGIESENKIIITSLYTGENKEVVIKNFNTVYDGSKLTYTGTTYEHGNILIGDPNSIFNGSENNSKVIINEIRDDYYSRYHFSLTIKYGINAEKYNFLEGQYQTYVIGKSNNATFKINARYDLFTNGGKVYIDNKLVDESNYTSKEGSTVITLKSAYLNNLLVGTHKLKVIFGNRAEATTNFFVNTNTYTIKVIKDEGVDVQPDGIIEGEVGDSKTFTVKIKDGYTIEYSSFCNEFIGSDIEIENDQITVTPAASGEWKLIIKTTKVQNSNFDSKTETEESNNPKTGDNIFVYFVVLVISIVGIFIVIFYKRKYKDKN